MKGRMHLIEWDAQAAQSLAGDLRADDWHVDVESEDGGRAFKEISAGLPDAVVIYLTHQPSDGLSLALALHKTAATKDIPLILVDGDADTVQKAKTQLPRALYLNSRGLRQMVAAFASSSVGAELTFSYRIELRDYDPNWPVYFEEEKARLMGVIGDRVQGVEHVGSTSVPGLASKAIVDLLVSVHDFGVAASCIEPLQALGYTYRDDLASLMPDRLFFERGTEDGLRFHVLVVEGGGPHWERYILFRDYLRANPDEAQRYEELKRHLASEHAEHRHEYSEAKADYVASVVARAREELGGR